MFLFLIFNKFVISMVSKISLAEEKLSKNEEHVIIFIINAEKQICEVIK